MGDEQNKFRALSGDRLAEAEEEAKNYDIGPPDELGQAREQISRLEEKLAALVRDAQSEGRRPLVTFAMEDWDAAVEKQERLETKVRELTTEAAELTHIFELQRKREKPWIKRWREWTGKHDSLPDYGDFLEFIVDMAEKAEVERMDMLASANYQLRRAESLSRTNAQNATQIATLEERVAELERMLRVADEDGREAKALIQELTTERDALKEEADHYRNMSVTSATECEFLRREKAELQRQLAEATTCGLCGERPTERNQLFICCENCTDIGVSRVPKEVFALQRQLADVKEEVERLTTCQYCTGSNPAIVHACRKCATIPLT